MKKIAGVVVATLAVVATSAQAALDPAVATGLTAVQADATSLNALAVPVVITVLGMMIVIKLIKRFGNKI